MFLSVPPRELYVFRKGLILRHFTLLLLYWFTLLCAVRGIVKDVLNYFTV